MPDLYLAWIGTSANDSNLYGIRCSTQLPHFEQPQSSWWGYLFPIGKPALLALSDRILLANQIYESIPGIFGSHSSSLVTQSCQSWPNWTANGITGSSSAWSAALASWPGGAIMVWNGVGSDTRVWTAVYHQSINDWSPQYLTELEGSGAAIQTGSTPAITNLNGRLVMVWLGEGSNDNLYYATSTDGIHWQGNRGVPGGSSSIAPALAVYNGVPVLCFKGAGSDHSIYTSSYNAALDYWSPVVRTGNYGTSHGPSLAVYQGLLFMTWKGINDTGIYWATTNNPNLPSAWSPQASIPNVGSAVGPAAVVF